jgi:hypothetical protein
MADVMEECYWIASVGWQLVVVGDDLSECVGAGTQYVNEGCAFDFETGYTHTDDTKFDTALLNAQS